MKKRDPKRRGRRIRELPITLDKLLGTLGSKPGDQELPMKAVLCRSFGPPESLEIVEIDDPTPGPQEIVVGVRAAAITFPDALMIEDKYQFKPKPPFIPG